MRRICWVVIAVVVAGTVWAEDWPSFRGPLGTGMSADKAAPQTWGQKENVRWRVELPDRGNSTPAVWEDKVFVTQAIGKEKRRELIAFDAKTGRELWRAGVKAPEKEPTNSQNPYCSASPTTDGERVVAFFGTPGLYCYDLAGKELWHREFGEVDSWHGSGSSPVISGGLCFLNFGPGTKSTLYALDMKSGEVVWKAAPPKGEGPRPGGPPGGPRPGGPPGGATETPTEFENAGRSGDFSGKGGFNGSWCTPLPLRTGDRDELVLVESSRVVAYDPKAGKELWSCKGLPMQVFASPAIGDGVLVAMGHNIPSGTKAMAVKLGGSGDVTETHRLWEVNLKKEVIGSGVVANGCVFLVTETGMAVCLDLKTGKQVWEERLPGGKGSWSSLVLAGDRVLAANQSGSVSAFAVSREFDLLQTNVIPTETTCSSPAISRGQVYLRTHAALWCFADTPKDKEPKTSERKKQVVDLLKSIETGDPKPAAIISPKKYTQHNLAVGDGIEGFAAVLKLLPKDSAKVKTVRVFEDGDFVFAHTEYDFFGPKIGFDVFRFEDGKIVEHWDNLQDTPKGPNPSKHTMTDGPVAVKDADKTAANKKLVGGFVDDILVNGKLDKLAGYFDGDNYVQHNPQIADGLTGLGKALETMAKAGVTMKYTKVHKVLGEGNFVLVMSEGEFGGKPVAFYDLFRVENGKVAEHWDTIQEIPEKKNWKNANGKF